MEKSKSSFECLDWLEYKTANLPSHLEIFSKGFLVILLLPCCDLSLKEDGKGQEEEGEESGLQCMSPPPLINSSTHFVLTVTENKAQGRKGKAQASELYRYLIQGEKYYSSNSIWEENSLTKQALIYPRRLSIMHFLKATLVDQLPLSINSP